jgi:hypothetical protein
MANFLNQVPQSSQTLAQTQNLILQNFTTYIDAAFQVDHVPYTTPGQGKHNKVSFPVQGSQPMLDSGDFGLYNFGGALVVASGSTILGKLTGSSLTTNGWSYWPTGALVKWGQITLGVGGVQVVAAAQGPLFANKYAIQLTNAGAVITTTFTLVSVGPAASNNFTVNCSDIAGGAFQYFIIGN